MTDSIRQVPQSPAVVHLAVMTRGIEYGFMAAGITVAIIAALQSIAIVWSWAFSGG